MRRVDLLSAFVACIMVMAAVCGSVREPVFAAEGDVEIDEANFPDELFRTYVADNYDKDHNGFLSPDERNRVTECIVADTDIASLEGLEFFPNLETLDCAFCKITSLDLSRNRKLVLLDCAGNDLGSLNVSWLTDLELLRCGECNLTVLDVTHNAKLLQIICKGNSISSLDLDNCSGILSIRAAQNKLKSLKIPESSKSKLVELDISSNNIASIDLSGATDLQLLMCQNNPKLKELDLSDSADLYGLECSYCDLSKLDISKNPSLRQMHCQGNKIYELDITKNQCLLDARAGNYDEWNDSNQNTVKSYATDERESLFWVDKFTKVIDGYTWKKSSGKLYYLDSKGNTTKGWKVIDDNKYYFDSKSGVMATSWKTIGGKRYYFNKTTGVVTTGWKTISKKKYYFDPAKDGAAVKGVAKKIKGYYYLFDSKGVMQKSGVKKDSKGNSYYLKSTGKAYTKKWYKKSGKWYYFGSNGKMVKGKSLKIGKKTYKFKASGVCKNP